jgi:hypothetical protein
MWRRVGHDEAIQRHRRITEAALYILDCLKKLDLCIIEREIANAFWVDERNNNGWFTNLSQKRCRQPGPFLGMDWLEAMAIANRVAIVSNLWGTPACLHHGLWQVSDFVAPVGPTSGTIELGARTPADQPPSRPFTPGNPRRTFGGNRFGVYRWLHHSIPIYIGKGTRNRPEQHKIKATNPGFKAYLDEHPECKWEFVIENVIESRGSLASGS